MYNEAMRAGAEMGGDLTTTAQMAGAVAAGQPRVAGLEMHQRHLYMQEARNKRVNIAAQHNEDGDQVVTATARKNVDDCLPAGPNQAGKPITSHHVILFSDYCSQNGVRQCRDASEEYEGRHHQLW